MSNYCIYLRKSRTDREAELCGEGETLARHEKTLINLAIKNNLYITTIYKEVVSGETIDSRPQMKKLLSDVEQGIYSGVLVMEIERLARGDTSDQGIVARTFKYSNTKIITPSKIYDPKNEFDEEYFEFGLFMSRREYKTINRRLQRGRLASVKEGNYLGSIPPYGYKREKLKNKKGYTLEIEPSQAEIVKLIFDLYVIGLKDENGIFKRQGAGKICEYLNKCQIPSSKGKNWVPATILGILKNPVYIGKIRWNARKTVKIIKNGEIKISRPRATAENYILTEGIHNPIIRKEIFEKAQKYRNSVIHTPVINNKKINNPLAGLVICGICGKKLTRRPYKNNCKPDVLMCTSPSCKNVSSKLNLVENKIITALENWLSEYRINYKIKNIENKNYYNISEKILIELKSKKMKTEKQLDNIYNIFEQGIYDNKKFLERSKLLSEKISYLEESIFYIEKEIKKNDTIIKQNNIPAPKTEKISDIYYKLPSPSAKNKFLKTIVEKIIYTKKENSRWHSSPDNFEIIIYPKIPKQKP